MNKTNLNKNCPVCGDEQVSSSVNRSNLVTMQNYIYKDYEDAVDAQTAKFQLCDCNNCGFAYNAVFDSNLLKYDENYDNNVPSQIFLDYYKNIAVFLHDKFSLENGTVVDVGCGKGTFLKVLCEMFPNVQGIGIDPSYEPSVLDKEIPNLTFVQDVFKEEHIEQKPSLILCRHVLEHIESPVTFLNSIISASKSFQEIPFFIEVPDLEWILDNNAFWDFCYEHCNYFTADSLKNTLQIAGFEVQQVQNAFKGQYLWSLGKIRDIENTKLGDHKVKSKLISYSSNEVNLIHKTKQKLKALKAENYLIGVWGMATKGVVFCNLIDEKKEFFDYCIDINEKKLKCFVPHTGHQINAPDILTKIESSKLMIIVMNPNYVAEINKTCQSLGLSPEFIDANGNEISL